LRHNRIAVTNDVEFVAQNILLGLRNTTFTAEIYFFLFRKLTDVCNIILDKKASL